MKIDPFTGNKIIGQSFKVEWCTLCDTFFVRCPKCGNNCCNGGYGLEGKCDVCPLCYQFQNVIDDFYTPLLKIKANI